MHPAQVVKAKWRANAALKFSHFLLNAFVRRVSRRMDILRVKFCLSMCEVQMRSGSGFPMSGTGITSETSPGD